MKIKTSQIKIGTRMLSQEVVTNYFTSGKKIIVTLEKNGKNRRVAEWNKNGNVYIASL